MRAVRAERLERAQQLRDRQSQAAQLVDARMRAALTDIERQLRHPTTRRNVFTLDRSGRVVFTKDRVWFDDAPRDEIAWPGSVEELIEAARTAEVMGRADQAATSYRRLMVIEPRLR